MLSGPLTKKILVDFEVENDFRKGSPTRVLAKQIFFVSRFIDLISGFGRQMRLLQVHRSCSTRSVFINTASTLLKMVFQTKFV